MLNPTLHNPREQDLSYKIARTHAFYIGWALFAVKNFTKYAGTPDATTLTLPLECEPFLDDVEDFGVRVEVLAQDETSLQAMRVRLVYVERPAIRGVQNYLEHTSLYLPQHFEDAWVGYLSASLSSMAAQEAQEGKKECLGGLYVPRAVLARVHKVANRMGLVLTELESSQRALYMQVGSLIHHPHLVSVKAALDFYEDSFLDGFLSSPNLTATIDVGEHPKPSLPLLRARLELLGSEVQKWQPRAHEHGFELLADFIRLARYANRAYIRLTKYKV